MTAELRIPQLGVSMTEGILQEWIAMEGQQVEAGAVIYTLETDKSVNDIEAPCAGRLKIAASAGETYQVGDLVGYIE